MIHAAAASTFPHPAAEAPPPAAPRRERARASRACPKCGATLALTPEPAAVACVLCGWRRVDVLPSERAWFAARADRRAVARYAPSAEDRAALWRQFRVDLQCGSLLAREDYYATLAGGRRRAALEELEPAAWFRRDVL